MLLQKGYQILLFLKPLTVSMNADTFWYQTKPNQMGFRETHSDM